MRLTIFQDHTIDSQEVLERQKKSKNSLIFYNTPTVNCRYPLLAFARREVAASGFTENCFLAEV